MHCSGCCLCRPWTMLIAPALATYPFYLHDYNEHEQHEHEHGNVLWWTCFSQLHSHDDIDHDGKHDLCWKRWFASESELFIALIIESKISYLHSAPSSLSTPFLLLGYHLSMQNCHGPPCDDLHLRKGCFAKASLQEESRDMEQGKIMKMVPCLIWESRFSCFCATTICHLRLFYVWCSVSYTIYWEGYGGVAKVVLVENAGKCWGFVFWKAIDLMQLSSLRKRCCISILEEERCLW